MAWYRKPTRPTWELIRKIEPSEWLRVENDDEAGVYITGGAALNLPTGPLGDWHGEMWHPPAGSGQSTRTKANEQLCQVGMQLWKNRELVDARPALQAIGHPQGTAEEPVWAASHPRAVSEMIIDSLLTTHRIDDPDVQSARRWLRTEQRQTCARLLEEAKPVLSTGEQRRKLDEWKTAVCASFGLCEAQPAS